MDQYHLYAYESLGMWSIAVGRLAIGHDGKVRDEMIYRGDHVPIDEEDPLIRTVLLLSQVVNDLNSAIRGELDTLADRPACH